MFEMLEEAGVRIRLGTIAIQPHLEGYSISAVECCDRIGPFTIKPRIVIDCSGDGDISAKAGVPHVLGDATGNMMAMTVSFFMIGVDGTDPVAVASATQEGRRRCHQLAQFLRSDVPGFEDAHMSMLSPSVGVRETRKLQGMYRLTGEDLLRATKFADGIVACDNPVDDVMRAEGDMTHDAAIENGQYYTIPFRSLVPETISNLMFAGRILSADPVAFASVRGMPQCMAMGQATGTAAVLSVRFDVPVQDVSTGLLVEELSRQGINRLAVPSLSEG